MRFGRIALLSACALLVALPATARTHTRRGATVHRIFHRRATKHEVRGQQSIDDARATQIQAALIKAGYLTGTPSGHWDSRTEAAVAKVQADNGWQTKLVPDSRAIIKLGLGPAADTPPSGDTIASTAAQTSYPEDSSAQNATQDSSGLE